MRKKSNKEFINELYNVNKQFKNKEFTIIGQYEGANIPLLVKGLYGYHMMTPSTLLSNHEVCRQNAVNEVHWLLNKFKAVHGNYYTYDKFIYNGNRILSTFTCPLHGDFLQTPCNHLRKNGCKMCQYVKLSNLKTKTTDKFIKDAILTHGDRYNYSKTFYKSKDKGVVIICKIHGEFTQRPDNHLNGSGCSRCNLSSPTALWDYCKCKNFTGFYIIELENKKEKFIKYGITINFKRRIKEFERIGYKVSILKYVWDNCNKIVSLENSINALYRKSYKPTIKFSGLTETCHYKNKHEILKHISIH